MVSVENEMVRFQRVLTTDKLECLESPREEGGVVDPEEEQRRNVREGVLDISLNLLRILKKEELADILESSKKLFIHIYNMMESSKNLYILIYNMMELEVRLHRGLNLDCDPFSNNRPALQHAVTSFYK